MGKNEEVVKLVVERGGILRKVVSMMKQLEQRRLDDEKLPILNNLKAEIKTFDSIEVHDHEEASYLVRLADWTRMKTVYFKKRMTSYYQGFIKTTIEAKKADTQIKETGS